MQNETGADPDWAGLNIGLAKDFLIDAAGRLVTLEGTVPTTQDPAVGALVLKEPYGVVLAMAPW